MLAWAPQAPAQQAGLPSETAPRSVLQSKIAHATMPRSAGRSGEASALQTAQAQAAAPDGRAGGGTGGADADPTAPIGGLPGTSLAGGGLPGAVGAAEAAAEAAAGAIGAQAEDLGDQVMRTLSETLAAGKAGAERAARAAVGAEALVAPPPLDPLPPDPVIVELFTSQGCSSCPPADALLAAMAGREDIVPLALHVDYWDYLGWEDPFAQPAFTARQKAYARAKGERMIFTPQMMIGGAESVLGTDAAAIDRVIAARQALKTPVRMQITHAAGGQVQIDLSAEPPLKEGTVVQIVRYAPQARVQILRGENAGLEIDYANVVTAWHAIAEWDGRTPTLIATRIEGDQPAVVIVQSAKPGKSVPLPGPIVAARRLQ